MEKAKKLFESVIDIHTEIRKESEKYLREMLAKNDNSTYLDDMGDYVCVAYDGGRHPEYDSNVFSAVRGVFLNDKGHVCLETEDCEEYDIQNINWDELYDVAMFIYENM